MKDKVKVVEINDRKFQIKKFDAFTGSYILFQLFEKAMPFMLDKKTGLDDKLPKNRSIMTKAEFMEFQKDCLSVVGEVLPARVAPLINENGSWGVNDIADDTALVILLTIHALTFNISDFFGEKQLKGLKEALSGLSLPNMPT